MRARSTRFPCTAMRAGTNAISFTSGCSQRGHAVGTMIVFSVLSAFSSPRCHRDDGLHAIQSQRQDTGVEMVTEVVAAKPNVGPSMNVLEHLARFAAVEPRVE